MGNFITLENVKKTFQNTLLFHDVNLSIDSQEKIGIFGPSGCGKTTLLHLIGCLDTPSFGKILIQGSEVTKENLLFHRRETFGFVFQNFHLLKSDTVLENVLLPTIISDPSQNRQKNKEKAKELLDLVGLKDQFYQDVNTLSGGEKQRVAIARAMIKNPSCILADEPTGNLDDETKEVIFSLLLNMVNEHKKTLIMVTHDSSFLPHFTKIYTIKQKSLCQAKL
jgi:ABC-type lipoprotein export system ATPase subunit